MTGERVLFLPFTAALAALVLLPVAGTGGRALSIGNAPAECFSDEDHPQDERLPRRTSR